MKFQIKDLKKLLSSLQNKQIAKIKITSNTFKLVINAQSVKRTEHLHTTNLSTNKEIEVLSKETTNIREKKDDSNKYLTIVSPMVGTFYKSPGPNEPAFVKLHDIVRQEQIICIIEAMKLMNEIEAEVNGEIMEILVKDGDVIDCGQALMKVKPI